jgi:Carboxypeptidase regulatory-like domain
MHHAMFGRAISIAASVAAFARLAGAQTSDQCPIKSGSAGGPGTIVGTISDTSLVPLDSVDVFISSPRRQTVSASGVFRLDSLRPKQYEVSARRLGYLPQTHTVTVGDSGGVAAFCLAPSTRTLDPIISSAPRSGLSGVIADTALHIIPGAEIAVLGGGGHAVSDSAGIFYVPLRPGRYMVRVKHASFEAKMVSISVPNDSGRKMLVWLAPANRAAKAREEAAARELDFRLDTAGGVWSKIFTREDIDNFPSTELRQLAQAGAVAHVDENCQAIIDGGPYTMPIWSLTAADLEMVEVYADKPPRSGSTSILNQRRQPTSTGPKCPHVYAWLRK